MNALKLRNLLIIGLVLTFSLIGIVMYFAGQELTKAVNETDHVKTDAKLSSQDIDRLKLLEKILAQNAVAIEKADQIVSESKQYEYQDQIIRDINRYASQTGVSVTGYDFGSETTNGSTASDPTIPKINGVKSLAVNITLASPIPFDNYLMFVKAIEQNLTKMQVKGVNISPSDKGAGLVANPTVSLIVFVR